MTKEWYNKIIQHDVTKKFSLPDNCIDVVITSPPYWGLRDYGIKGQIGLEKHPQEYIDKMVKVCQEIKRVLKKSGSFYLNLGDTYYGSPPGNVDESSYVAKANVGATKNKSQLIGMKGRSFNPDKKWLQPKQLMLIPSRVAIALQNDGWILRNDIIWHKCISGNTPVYIRSMGKPLRTSIREMYRLPLETLEIAGKNGWRKVIRIEKQPSSKLLTIHLRNGVRIETTPEHRFPTKNGILESIKLKKGDELIFNRLEDEIGSSLGTKEVGWIIGLYLAEGSNKKKGLQFSLHKKEIAFANKIIEFANIFAGCCKKYIYGNNLHVVLSGKACVGIIKNYVDGDTSKNKHLSRSAFMENNQFLEGVLKGYLDGDGHYESKNDRWKIGFTLNRELEWDLRTICARLEYHIRAFVRKARIKKKEYPCISGEIRKRTSGHFNQKDDYEILRIEKTKGITYDLEVDGDHLFCVCGGVLTHNSNPMPSSVKDRLNNTFEHVFHFVKSRKYYYDLDCIRIPHKAVSLQRVSQNLGKPVLNTDRKRGHPIGADTLDPKQFLHKNGKNPGDVIKYDGKFKDKSKHYQSVSERKNYQRQVLGVPHDLATSHPIGKNPGDVLRSDAVKYGKDVGNRGRLLPKEDMTYNVVGKNPGDVVDWKENDLNEDGKPRVSTLWKSSGVPRTTHPLGKAPGDFWNICTQPFTSYNPDLEHFAVFPEELVIKPIKSSCPKDGVVLDPFGGRGTVGKVAKELGLNYVLFDIKPEYCELARLYIDGQKTKLIKHQKKLKI